MYYTSKLEVRCARFASIACALLLRKKLSERVDIFDQPCAEALAIRAVPVTVMNIYNYFLLLLSKGPRLLGKDINKYGFRL